MLTLVALVACSRGEPRWDVIPPIELAPGGSATVALADYLEDPSDADFSARPGDGLTATVHGSTLTVTALPDYAGTTSVRATATVGSRSSATTVVVTVDPALAASCPTEFRYVARGGADRVFLAGAFNDWSDTATPMEKDGDAWAISLDLPPGAWPYKFVESIGGTPTWTCDPDNGAFQCDAGYSWDASCPLGGAGCNSLRTVPACEADSLQVTTLSIDRAANAVDVQVAASGALSGAWATLDGDDVDAADGAGFQFSASGLADGRHTLRFGAEGVAPVYVPFWLDDRSWRTGLLYFAFVDRFADGDPNNDGSEGATAPLGDYVGGDWQGVRDHLGYLDSLGVTAIWLTAPLDGPSGAFDGLCGVTYAGYHGYWPAGTALEEHFGSDADLRALVDDAHARGIRVLVDLVANHVHQDHPWFADHPEWFGEEHLCDVDDDGDGVVNWDQRPETCWFTSYLPDLDYYQVDPMLATVDGAMAMAEDYGFDGFRIDAVKHMPHSLHATLQDRIGREIEHSDAGGDEEFYTVGETFTGDRGLIASYIGDRELDGQFDFPLYWAILQAFARDEIGLSDGPGSLSDVRAQGEAAWGDAQMSTFLGNHDVYRFIAQANGEVGSLYGDGSCAADGGPLPSDAAPTSSDPYDRLRMAWTFLLTSPGLPLVYYGDELGLPGYGDPDNRQVMRFEPDLSANEAAVLAQVRALGLARRDHPAFALGTTVGWWENEADFWAYARTSGSDAVLVLLNRAPSPRVVTNGLAFAGLPSGSWVDVLTGDRFVPSGDALTVDVPGRGSRVLVPE